RPSPPVPRPEFPCVWKPCVRSSGEHDVVGPSMTETPRQVFCETEQAGRLTGARFRIPFGFLTAAWTFDSRPMSPLARERRESAFSFGFSSHSGHRLHGHFRPRYGRDVSLL